MWVITVVVDLCLLFGLGGLFLLLVGCGLGGLGGFLLGVVGVCYGGLWVFCGVFVP